METYMITVDLFSKDWRESWDYEDLRNIQMERGLLYSIEIPQDEVESNFLILSNRALTSEQAMDLWEAGIVGIDGPVSAKNLTELKILLEDYG